MHSAGNITPDNTITITRVEPQRSIYSLEDMEKAFEAGADHRSDCVLSQQNPEYKEMAPHFEEWIKLFNNPKT